jgi:hypothetical protein
MATTNGNRKILDLKRWEFCTPAPVATAAGVFVSSSRHFKQRQLYVQSATAAYLYLPEEDGFVQVASPALAGTFGVGATGVAGAWSTGTSVATASLTATAGTTSSITTNQTLAVDLRGYSVQILAGPNAGETKVIASNTIGANAVITFTAASASAFSASTVYRLCTPVWYVLGAGTLAANIFKKYDYATNTWTALTQTGLPATIGTDSKLISTPSWLGSNYVSFATGTATGGTANTISNTAKSWSTNQWANYQIRITGGTGAGQIRTIASNTGTAITVSTNWGTNPDASSTYSIEGNDDYLYYIGSNAVTLYRYSITSNTWSTLTPTAARAAAPGAGMSGQWIWEVSASEWTNENAILNGKYIYSFRGAAGAGLDRYDIAANTWENLSTYTPGTETFTTGTKHVYSGDYIYSQKDATGRWFRFSIPKREQDGFGTMTYTQGAAVAGDTCFDALYTDGATQITYIYMILNTSTVMLRMMVI